MKICLICQGKRIKKKKTTVKKNTLSPVYNEALVFDLPAENVFDVTLLVKVIDYDRWVISESIRLPFFLRQEKCLMYAYYIILHQPRGQPRAMWDSCGNSELQKNIVVTQ